MKKNKKKLFIIDGYAILYRAHFALIRNPLITSYVFHTSPLFGFYNHLHKKKIAIPPREDHDKATQFEGAYVKDPQLGLHKWIVSFDLNSLYPHLIMQYNNSPETYVGVEPKNVGVENYLNQKYNTKWLKDKDVTIAPNGAMFRRDKLGFLQGLWKIIIDDCVIFKMKRIRAVARGETQRLNIADQVSKRSACPDFRVPLRNGCRVLPALFQSSGSWDYFLPKMPP